jgi:hypothetical protein
MKKLFIYVLLIFSFSIVLGHTEPYPEMEWGPMRAIIESTPDPRATGHRIYVLNTETNVEQMKEVVSDNSVDYAKEEFNPNVLYKFTATAHATINEKFMESERSDPVYIKFIEPIDPIIKPNAPKLIRLHY